MEPLVAKFFVAQIDEKSTKNRRKIGQKSIKIAKKRKKAPKSAQERHKALGPQSCSALGAVLNRSWDALGPLRAAPNAAKGAKIRAQTQFFAFFLNVIFRINFCIDFLTIFYRFFEAPTLKNSNFPLEK